jgi:ribose 5-phosphate isomerase B
MSGFSGTPGGPVPTEAEVRSVVAAILAELELDEGARTSPPAEPGTSTPGPSAVSEPGADAASDVALGADHGGYRLKERIAAELRELGLRVYDCGTDGTDPVDYPDFAHGVAALVAQGTCRVGIVVDGAGIGSCMVANKVPGVRAATCWDVSSARNSREHNHANVLSLGAGLLGESLALEIVRAWLDTPWGRERHARRVGKIAEIERTYLRSEVGARR